jgi:hypothetical protein
MCSIKKQMLGSFLVGFNIDRISDGVFLIDDNQVNMNMKDTKIKDEKFQLPSSSRQSGWHFSSYSLGRSDLYGVLKVLCGCAALLTESTDLQMPALCKSPHNPVSSYDIRKFPQMPLLRVVYASYCN